MIRDIVNPVPLEVGMEFDGKVVKAMDFGAFVNIVPGKDGLRPHLEAGEAGAASGWRGSRTSSNVGDTVRVRISEIRADGKLNLEPADVPATWRGLRRRGAGIAQWRFRRRVTRPLTSFERSEPLPGLRLVTESMPHVRSVSIGFWLDTGARDETDELAGAAHFLEHMLFKGTEARSAQDIANAFDAVGGEVNAYSAREHTCFYARVLDRDLPMAVEILGGHVPQRSRCVRTSSSRSAA